MENMITLVTQIPIPGKRILMFRGDTLKVELELSQKREGEAYLRTNIGNAEIARNEVIRLVEYKEPILATDWFDVPMTRVDEKRFQVVLPICQVGHFEAKGYFLPKQNQKQIWPAGSNLNINVEPAHTCCGNTIYNAFVRQFGPNKSGGFFDPRKNDEIGKMDGLGYTVIPPSGTFRNLIKDLDFIFGELGCRYIQLLPIYPTPTTYARMGRFGSPYAALSFN